MKAKLLGCTLIPLTELGEKKRCEAIDLVARGRVSAKLPVCVPSWDDPASRGQPKGTRNVHKQEGKITRRPEGSINRIEPRLPARKM